MRKAHDEQNLKNINKIRINIPRLKQQNSFVKNFSLIHQNSSSFGEKGRHERGREEDFWDGNNFVFLNLGSTYITLFVL